MSKQETNVQGQIDRLVAYQAAEWFERLKDGAGDRNAAFVNWVTESPRHMQAFLAVSAQAPLIRRVFDSGAFDLSTLLQNARPEVLELPSLQVAQSSKKEERQTGRWRSRARVWSVAAALSAVILSTLYYFQVASWQRYETPVGEQRAVQLSEGSVVNLNALSRLDVKFDRAHREIKLPRGEATFKVAPDRVRPFRVRTPAATVEAVGTEFNVYARKDGTTTVAVLEGEVQVRSDRGDNEPVPLLAGDEAQVHADGRIQLQEHKDVAEAVAWQQRKLIFKRTTLEDMATEFNRYNGKTRIRLEGIERNNFRFSGAFNADDPQSLATLLAREPDLTVKQSENEIVIRRR